MLARGACSKCYAACHAARSAWLGLAHVSGPCRPSQYPATLLASRGGRMRLALAFIGCALVGCFGGNKDNEGQELSKNPLAALGQVSDAVKKGAAAAQEVQAMQAQK